MYPFPLCESLLTAESYSNDESESNFQPVPSKKKTQKVKNLKVAPRVISYHDEDDLLQARGASQSQSHRAEDANRNSQKHSRKAQTPENKPRGDNTSAKPQQVKKGSKTQGNNIPQAAEEAPTRPTTVKKSETSRTTADNHPVGIAKASNPPASKKEALPKPPVKPDSISIKTVNGNLSGDEDQKEREEMLASPVKGSDAQTASTVSQITLFDRIFTSLYVRPLSNLR
jgi:hypothetical protein